MEGLRFPKPCLPHAALQHSSHSSEPIQEDLEQRISKLKTSLERDSSLELLREVRVLLQEADLALRSEQN